MGKIYIRFSTPGGKGYVPGTSKDKFHNDWIEAPTFDVSGNFARKEFSSVSFHHQHDKSSERFQNFALSGSQIDKVMIERVEDDGALSARVVMEDAVINSFNQMRKGGETVVLGARNITLDEFPAKKRVGDLSLAHGIRSEAFSA